MLISVVEAMSSGDGMLDCANNDCGRDTRGEWLGELLPAPVWMGNCSDSRFPAPTTSAEEVVFERECGILTGKASEGVQSEVREIVVVLLEEAVDWRFVSAPAAPLQPSRVPARPGFLLAEAISCSSLLNKQTNVLNHRRRNSRCTISEAEAAEAGLSSQ